MIFFFMEQGIEDSNPSFAMKSFSVWVMDKPTSKEASNIAMLC